MAECSQAGHLTFTADQLSKFDLPPFGSNRSKLTVAEKYTVTERAQQRVEKQSS